MLALAAAPALGAAPRLPIFPFPAAMARGRWRMDFPQKGTMVLQRSRPPLLETPFTDFDGRRLHAQREILRALALVGAARPKSIPHLSG